jgi:D-3-phosphoglycerate dehydrogenase / 2-oxoglutarate reductase
MTQRVLISDNLSETAVEILRSHGIDVDYRPELGKDKARLADEIGPYDGLAVRSATKVTERLLAAAPRLRVVGRAGIGVDNVDLAAASKKGVVVMNTPFGNSITTAEHTIALLMALVRQIPEANASTHAGKWEKARFMGSEVTGKTLGVIGAGNIGSIVANRAQGLGMKVVAYDPFLGEDRARKLGVEKVDLDTLLRRADIVTLHVPLTDQTRMILDAAALARTRPGVRIVNCARGGLVDEAALAEAIRAGHVAGAAIDAFEVEPAVASPLFGLPQVVCTPHLGASTAEAQENVARQIAEQMADYLLHGAVSNAVNMPSITAEEAPVLTPWVRLATHLGGFVGQMTDEPIRAINLLFNGAVAAMNTQALTSAAVAGVMRATNPEINMVSGPVIARERGIDVTTTTQEKTGVFDAYVKLTVVSESRERSIAGTVFTDGKPRFIQIKGITIDAEIAPDMIYTTNADVPGIIGTLGGTLGDLGVNIANFTLGRSGVGGEAIALLSLDGPPPAAAIAALQATGRFGQVRPLSFDIA